MLVNLNRLILAYIDRLMLAYIDRLMLAYIDRLMLAYIDRLMNITRKQNTSAEYKTSHAHIHIQRVYEQNILTTQNSLQQFLLFCKVYKAFFFDEVHS